jgi:hypothetical protein
MSFITDGERHRIERARILKIDKDTLADIKEFGVHQEPAINFKQHQECRLFRCLVCWMMIHPDDEIINHKEGYAHKICLNGTKPFARRITNKEMLLQERAQCNKCHHSKRVHSEFGYGCLGIVIGRGNTIHGYSCGCQCFRPYKDGRII